MDCKPGDLVFVPFPYSDLTTSKKRPVLVLTAPDRHGDFIGLAVTSVQTNAHAVRIESADLSQGSLPRTSWVRLDKIFTLAEGSIFKPFGTLTSAAMKNVLADCAGESGVSTDGLKGCNSNVSGRSSVCARASNQQS